MPHFAVIDAPSVLGLKPTGVERLPEALKAAGLMAGLSAEYAGRVDAATDNPRRDPDTLILNPDALRGYALALAAAVAGVLQQGKFPVVLGGDCSNIIGIMLALRRIGRYGLVFIDGHANFYQPEVGPNGEVASMDLAIVSSRCPAVLTDIDGLKPLEFLTLPWTRMDQLCVGWSPAWSRGCSRTRAPRRLRAFPIDSSIVLGPLAPATNICEPAPASRAIALWEVPIQKRNDSIRGLRDVRVLVVDLDVVVRLDPHKLLRPACGSVGRLRVLRQQEEVPRAMNDQERRRGDKRGVRDRVVDEVRPQRGRRHLVRPGGRVVPVRPVVVAIRFVVRHHGHRHLRR